VMRMPRSLEMDEGNKDARKGTSFLHILVMLLLLLFSID